MKIPVFHDDQHGTAISHCGGAQRGLRGEEEYLTMLVVVLAGAASIACLNPAGGAGARQQNITVCDLKGVIYKGRDANMEQTKAAYAIEDNGQRIAGRRHPERRHLPRLLRPGRLDAGYGENHGARSADHGAGQPEPEILPPLAKAVRPDAIICTGRSDYPNQVNNVLCFLFIFRGALDTGATTINEEMKLACVHAIADPGAGGAERRGGFRL